MIRCAIYTRKSAEAGLEQDFNSLDAQREACSAYIASQKGLGWVELPERYDDGGISGGTLERPGIAQLMADVEAGKVDRIVVYKIDRLTRSLTDFAKLVERLDQAKASFVSVTQSFDTGTSMGRLTLNMLLSFAQFEREVTAERIRDKIAASKTKGIWMGGLPPLGYDAKDKALVVNESEAEIVQTIFGLYLELKSIPALKAEVDRRGLRTKRRTKLNGETEGGVAFTRGRLHHLLTNPVYIGKTRHGAKLHRGRHAAIISDDIWETTQATLIAAAQKPRGARRKLGASPLQGRLFDEDGEALVVTHTNKGGRRYRYYVSSKSAKRLRLPAHEVERAVAEAIAAEISSAAFGRKALEIPTIEGIAQLHANAGRLAAQLRAPGGAHLIGELVEAVHLGGGEICIVLRLNAVAAVFGIPAGELASSALELTANVNLQRRGGQKALVLDRAHRPVDQTLLRTVAQGRLWAEQVRRDEITVEDIARRQNCARNWVMRHIEIAALSPKIVEQVAEGRQPIGLTAAALLRNAPNVAWKAQRDRF